MARVQTMIQLTDDLVAQLDREAGRRGCSRSALIREAISEHLADADLDEKVRRYVDGYRRIPQGAIDEWGDVARGLERSASETRRRLDAEERAAGLEW